MPKIRFSVCRKAVSEFKSLDPSLEFLADLVLYIPECAIKMTKNYGNMSEQFYIAAGNNLNVAIKYINEHNLYQVFQKRIEIITQKLY